MPEQISFIHAADLHLDSPFQGLASVPEDIFKQIQASTFQALDKLVKTAITKKVDFILLVGDLFDNERQSLRAQMKLKEAFEELNHHGINVYVSYGNHDFLNGNRYPVTYPDNVYIFNEEKVASITFIKNNNPAAMIYGFSYENRSVTSNKTTEYTLSDAKADYHIAMLHGSISSNTEHDTYAPFNLSELVDKDFDYWALGHIHQKEMLKIDPPVIYPGNTQGRNRKETGEKGCYHVVLASGAPKINFIPLNVLQFNSLEVDVTECNAPFDLEKIVLQAIDKQKYEVPQLLSLNITGNNSSIQNWEQDGLIEEIIDLLNESMTRKTNWNFVYRYQVNTQNNYDEKELRKGNHFIGELLRHSEEASVFEYIDDLYRHRQARKYLDAVSMDEAANIKAQAKQLLLKELLKSEGE